MTTNEPMGEVINLPVRPDPAPPATAPAGAAGGARPPFPPAPATSDPDGADHDAGEVLEGTVLVDQPDTGRPDIRARMLADTGQRRPIIAPWLRDRDEARATMRWAGGYAAHVTGYHAARVPLYGLRLALRSPRGLWRALVGTWRWTCDAEAMPLRMHAADRKDADTYLKLLRERDDRVRWRRIVAGAGLAGTGLAASTVMA